MKKDVYLSVLEQDKKRTFSLKRFCYEHDDAVCTIMVVVGIIIGFAISWNFFFNPLSEEQFQELESVATSITSSEASVFNQPENISVEYHDNKMLVSYKSIRSTEKIVVDFEDGKSSMTRDNGLFELIIFVFVFCVIGAMISTLISFAFMSYILEEKRKKIFTNLEIIA